ncbi:hypothetical protein ABZZ80_29880, partial [Streptomyces sp. NPDC006356]
MCGGAARPVGVPVVASATGPGVGRSPTGMGAGSVRVGAVGTGSCWGTARCTGVPGAVLLPGAVVARLLGGFVWSAGSVRGVARWIGALVAAPSPGVVGAGAGLPGEVASGTGPVCPTRVVGVSLGRGTARCTGRPAAVPPSGAVVAGVSAGFRCRV